MKDRKTIVLPGYFLTVCSFLLAAYLGYGQPLDGSLPSFKKITISNDFISEGVAVGDINNDGLMDILAGSCWFEAPQWKRHELAPGKVYNARTEYCQSFLNHCMDVNMDGWNDLIVIGFPGTSAIWYENNKNGTGHWKKHLIFESVGNESPAFADVDGDGRTDILCADGKEKQMIWLKSPVEKGETGWKKFMISEKGHPDAGIFSHGLGYADMNKDGRSDLVTKNGWWESPVNPKQANWKFHPADLGEDCSQMHVMDVNNDSTMDVISASAHRVGVWWHQMVKDEAGRLNWEHHTISYTVSQTHAVAVADFNGDGYQDLVTGKRYFAHLERYNPSNRTTIDPGTYEKPVILWFEHTSKPPYWIEHEIDDNSGVGLNIEVHDMNNDGLVDIIIANKRGVFLFENLMKKK